MTYMLSQLLQAAQRRLGNLEETIATGGSTSTAIDTKLTDKYADDDLIDGTLFVTYDAGGSSAAPENELALITGYTAATNTISCGTSAFTVAVAAGDRIGIARPIYPLYTMISLANDALTGLGDISLVDISTTTVSDKAEYDWSVAWKRKPPFRIDIQTRTDAPTLDNDWAEIFGWYVVPATANTAGKIIFPNSLDASKLLRIWYVDKHPTLTAYNSYLSETIQPELAICMLVNRALEWQVTRTSGSDEFLKQRWNDAKDALDEARRRWPIYRSPRSPKIFTTRGQLHSTDVSKINIGE